MAHSKDVLRALKAKDAGKVVIFILGNEVDPERIKTRVKIIGMENDSIVITDAEFTRLHAIHGEDTAKVLAQPRQPGTLVRIPKSS